MIKVFHFEDLLLYEKRFDVFVVAKKSTQLQIRKEGEGIVFSNVM